ncbi:MAG: hypothetical protein ACYC5K_02220 [Saccharofermentanales bacterium]
MRCEDCGKEFSFIGKNTLCAECLMRGPIKKKPKKEKPADEKKASETLKPDNHSKPR